ncbi:hypothetical protein F66182_842 [Fusarium sp. NRRL 66182]|nr:hypothetical protein F66182_842 [Fusarium sp. NRRL 66182]
MSYHLNDQQTHGHEPHAHSQQVDHQQTSPQPGQNWHHPHQQSSDFSQLEVLQPSPQPQVYPQHSFQQQPVPPQPYPAQTSLPQAVSPELASPVSFADPAYLDTVSQQHSPWLDPQSPNLRDTATFDRSYDIHRGLMGNEPTNVSYDKTPNVGAVRRSTTIALPESGPLWLRVVKSRWSMVGCLIFGVAAALGHHFLYNALDGREALNQQWWLRLGQLISFISNASFVLAAMMAHQQIAWQAVGKKGFSVKAVDSLFGSGHYITELFSREAWVKSWFVMFLALYMWFSPLVVILTSATLDVEPGDKVENTLCPSVRTLNFSNEAKESYQTPKRAESETFKNGLSLSGYNVTAPGGNLAEDAEDLDAFEYYNVPSSFLVRIADGVFSSGQPIHKKDVALEICGEGWNCSTTIHFVGPGYNCKEVANGVGSEMESFGDAEPPFDLSQLVPVSNFTYWADTDKGEYMRPQMSNVSVGGIPSEEDGPPFPENLGAFRTEPMIWIGYAAVEDYNKLHANSSEADGWNDDYTPIIFACDHWEVNYTVTFNYTAGFQTYNVTNRDYKRKIIDTTWSSWTNESTDGTADGNVAEPERNYVSPRNDYARYRRIAAFHSLGLKLREAIFGNVRVQGGVAADGPITATTLLNRPESLAVPNFQDEVRRTYEDLLISLLSDPQLLAVAWAADPSKLSGTGVGGQDTKYECERRQIANFFDYDWPILVAVYVVSFVIASVGVYFGISAMASDGTYAQRGMTFSSIAGATKSVSADQIESKDTRIRCFPVEERSGDRSYEFRAELEG